MAIYTWHHVPPAPTVSTRAKCFHHAVYRYTHIMVRACADITDSEALPSECFYTLYSAWCNARIN